MLSKSISVAITTLILFLFACSTVRVPWRNEKPGDEVNLAFTIENNLLFLSTVRINQEAGRYFFGSAHQRSILDPAFAARLSSRTWQLHLNNRDEVALTPVVVGLGGLGDALIGADAWSQKAVTIDYRSGLLTYQKSGIYPAGMTLFRFDAEPTILADVDGQRIPVIVDTALPDSLVLPRRGGAAGRRTVHVKIAGTDFGAIDVAVDDVPVARAGNRVLSRFLISIDYGGRQVGLWRDPRTAM